MWYDAGRLDAGRADVAIEIVIDRETCMGSGNCSFLAPGVFELGDDGVAVVKDPDGEPEARVVLAAEGCPTQSITVRKDGAPVAPLAP
jgi:ferredoxin